MIGQLSEKKSREFLRKNVFGHLGCSANGKTYVVPISFASDGNDIYCHTLEGQKIDMMRSNPSVCFQVDDLESMAQWKSVIVQGTYKELSGKERRKGLQALLDRKMQAVVSETVKISPDWPFSDAKTIQVPGIIFRISVDEISGRFEEPDAQRK